MVKIKVVTVYRNGNLLGVIVENEVGSCVTSYLGDAYYEGGYEKAMAFARGLKYGIELYGGESVVILEESSGR